MDRWPKLSFGRIEFGCLPLRIQGKLHIPKVLGFRVPQTVLITIFCGLVAKIIVLENLICSFIRDNTMKAKYPKSPGTPYPPNHINHYILRFVTKIIICENWICLFIIANTRKHECPKGPGTPGPPNHINHYVLGFGGLDHHLGELDHIVYRWKYKEICIPHKSRDPGSPKPY